MPEGTDLSHLDVSPEPLVGKLKISQLLNSSEKGHLLINAKFTVYYQAGVSGNIKGNLSLNSNYLIFNPCLDDQENIDKFSGTGNEFLMQ